VEDLTGRGEFGSTSMVQVQAMFSNIHAAMSL
jgi:hypothetical protein